LPDIIKIQGTEIAPGESKSATLNVAKLPTRTTIDIPVFIFRGEEDGPVLFLQGGTHGDEINGIEIVRRMIAGRMIKPKRGSVIAVPLLNIYGFLNYSREVPGGKDVNRFYPGNKKGSLASRVAYHVFNEVIMPYADCGIDFHTGGGSIDNYPQTRCVFDAEDQLSLAKAFGAHFIINSKFINGSLRKAANKEGIPILVFEGGESLRIDNHSIQEGIKGVMRLMSYLGITDKKQEPYAESILLPQSSWQRSKDSGIFTHHAHVGEFVEKGKIIGSITDPYGEFERTVKATHSGYIVGLNNKPVLNQGDPIIHIGMI